MPDISGEQVTYQSTLVRDDRTYLSNPLGWVTSGRAEILEIVAFRSAASLTALDQLENNPIHGLPLKQLTIQLALISATATSKLDGWMALEADTGDAYHLTPLCEARSPDGDLLAFERAAVH
ncbi:MAG: DUF1403 family protein [Pseudomonadota bacterium]